MKRLIKALFFLWFFVFLFLSARQPAKAQVSQNIILSCLNAVSVKPDPQTVEGVSYHHLINLKNKELGIFVPNQSVYIIRSFAKVFCNPNDNDPECIKDSQNRISPCIQEDVGANICNQNCPWGNHVCKPNNAGDGKTVCCMPLYTKQGPYFECAKDRAGAVVCPESVLAQQGQNNGIHISENGHIETGGESAFIIISNNKDNLKADAEGNISIDLSQDYTRTSLDRGFYGMQIVADQAITDNDAFRNTLKLALFTQTEVVEPSAVNCTTIFWDPYGKVIDSLRLEPVFDLPILLKNLDINGQVVNTTVANNPAFKNPELTDLAGNFNFAVSPGTYFLEPLTTNFTFPIDSAILSQALSILQSFDPEQEYIQRDKVYNNLTEPIVESAGYSERRDIIIQPKDPLYPGSAPSIVYAENLRHEDNQLVRGRASHPKSLIKVYLGSNLVGQTEADIKGGFSLIIPQSVIDNNPGSFQIFAEKVPIPGTVSQSRTPKTGLFSWLVSRVLAQQSNTSGPYPLSLVPVRISGFVFDSTIQVQPNAIVQLSIPSLGNVNYSQTRADEDGYINIDSTNLPPFNFVITVRNPSEPGQSYQLTIDDFKKTNTVYLKETGANLYNAQVAAVKPDKQTTDRIVKETPRRVPAHSLSLNQPTPSPIQTTEETPSRSNNNNAFLFVFAFLLVVILLIGFIIVKRNKSDKQIYY